MRARAEPLPINACDRQNPEAAIDRETRGGKAQIGMDRGGKRAVRVR